MAALALLAVVVGGGVILSFAWAGGLLFLGPVVMVVVGLTAATRRAGPLPGWGRALFTVLAVLVATGGLLVVGAGMLHLRTAHLNRQRWGEGIGFARVGAAVLVLGACVATASAGSLVALWGRSKGWRRVSTFAVALSIVGVVVASAMVVRWVEGHGVRCIGPCG